MGRDTRPTCAATPPTDYWILATDSYADEMVFLAVTSPWGQQYYAAARAEADRVALVAPAQRDRQITAAEAARDYAQDEAAAEKAKVVDEATAGHDRTVAVAEAEHTRAVAEADALAADGDYSPPRLDTPGSGGAQIVSAGMALNGEPVDFARDSGFGDLFNSIADGWMGDGYFMGIVSSMFYVAPARDELGYTNGVHRFLSENLIRPVVGDQALINATDTQLLLGTAAVCAAPFLIAAAPAMIMAAPGLIMAAPWAFASAIVVGAAIGGAYNVAGQLDAGVSWGEIDWWSVGTSALVGGAMGAACFVGFGYLAAAIPGFCTVATVAGFGLGGYSIYNGIHGVRSIYSFSACSLWLDRRSPRPKPTTPSRSPTACLPSGRDARHGPRRAARPTRARLESWVAASGVPSMRDLVRRPAGQERVRPPPS